MTIERLKQVKNVISDVYQALPDVRPAVAAASLSRKRSRIS